MVKFSSKRPRLLPDKGSDVSSDQPILGTQISKNCSLHINLTQLKDCFRKGGLTGMELIFYPEDGSREATEETKGKGAFQFGDKTPLVWSCTFGEFLIIVKGYSFIPFRDDKLAFQNPLLGAYLKPVD